MADGDAIISWSDLIAKDNTFKELSDNIDQIRKELMQMAKDVQKAFKGVKPSDSAKIAELEKEVRKLTIANKNLIKAEKIVNDTKKKNIELTQEELVQREAEKIAKREAVKQAKQLAIIQKEEKNTIASLRAQLSLVTDQWKKLTAEEIKNNAVIDKNGKTANDLVNTKKRLTEQLKKLEKQTGDNRRSVGNYTSALDKLDGVGKRVRGTLFKLFLGRTLIDGVRRITGALGELVNKFRESNSAIGGIGNAFDKLTSSLEFAGTKILETLAPAIIKIANALSTMPAIIAGASAAFEQFLLKVNSLAFVAFSQLNKLSLEFEKISPLSSRSAAQIQKDIDRLDQAIALSNARRAKGIGEAYNDAYNKVIKEQEEFFKQQQEAEKKEAREAAREARKNAEEIERQRLEARLQAIARLQAELTRLETENIEDRKIRALSLEELRFKEELALREMQFKELQDAFAGNEEKLKELSDLRRDLDLESERQYQENLQGIRKQFLLSTEKIEALTQEKIEKRREEERIAFNKKYGIDLEQVKKNQADITEEFKKGVKERSDAQKEESERILKQISQTAEKIGQEIAKVYEKQADLAKESVNEQQQNLERARDRAAQGLKSNIAFEEAELAKRQAEQQRAQKQAQQIAKLTTLFNLVSAYAQSGDENALFRGLADFAILEAFSAGIQGFYEGTENVEQSLGSSSKTFKGKDAYLGMTKAGNLFRFDGKERIFNPDQNMMLAGMTNDEVVRNAILGESVSDNYNSFSSQSLFKQQQDDFVKKSKQKISSTSNMEAYLARIEKRLANQPNIGIEIQKVYENVVDMIKSEVRVSLKKISRSRLKG